MPIRATDAPPPVAPTRGPSEFKALAAALEELGARLEPLAASAGSGGGAAAAAAGSDVCARTAALDAILATLPVYNPNPNPNLLTLTLALTLTLTLT